MDYSQLSSSLDCAELVLLCPKTYNKVNLYRGLNHLPGECGKTLMGIWRDPRSSSIEYHSILNGIFFKIFGIPIRSLTVFCTGSKDIILGELYKSFPSDNFEVFWSDTINDLYYLNRSKSFLQNPAYSPFISIYCLIAKRTDKRTCEDLELTLNEWPLARDFSTSFYPEYAHNYPDLAMRTVAKILRDHHGSIVEFFSKMYKRGNTISDLQAAAASQNEVMIACDFYCWKHYGKE